MTVRLWYSRGTHSIGDGRVQFDHDYVSGTLLFSATYQ